MRVRKLDKNGDRVFGNGQSDFWVNVPDGPAQCVQTRLGLYLGTWFLDITDGTPWRTKVLGKFTNATRDPVLRARILGTQGILRINTYASQVQRDTRNYAVQVNLDTIYGRNIVATLTARPDVDVIQGR